MVRSKKGGQKHSGVSLGHAAYKIHASDEGPDGLHLLLTQRHFVRNMLRLQSVKSSDDVIGEKGVDAPHCEHLGLRAVE